MEKQQILSELKDLLLSNYGEYIDSIILYGSQSRGTAKEDSDYDILIILKEDYDWKFRSELLALTNNIDLKYDVMTDVRMISLPEMKTIKGKQPFILNVLEEGIIL